MSEREIKDLLATEGRALTEDEIEFIVKDVPPFPSASKSVREYMRERIVARMRQNLHGKVIIPEILPELKKRMIHALEYSYISPGEAVGPIAAGAVSAPATQMNLSAYHLIGIGGGDSLKSLLEIFGVRIDRSPESMFIHLNDYTMTESEVYETMYRLEGISITDLLVPTDGEEIIEYFSVDTLKEHIPWFDLWFGITKKSQKFLGKTNVMFRLKFNVTQLYTYGITLPSIVQSLENVDGVSCIASPTKVGYVDIFVNAEHALNMINDHSSGNIMNTEDASYLYYDKAVRVVFNNVFGKDRIGKLKNCYIREVSIMTKMNLRELAHDDGTWTVYADATETRIEGISDLKIRSLWTALGFEVMSGKYVSGEISYHLSPIVDLEGKSIKTYINQQVSQADDNFNKYRKESSSSGRYTTGTDFELGNVFRASKYCYAIANTDTFKQILAHPMVDGRMTMLKNPYKVFLTLGIEAARNVIVREIWDIINMSGNSIDIHHVTLIADHMCWIGSIVATTSRGASRLGRETISDATFEKPLDFIQKASLLGEKETTVSTSTCVFLGTKCGLGTGATTTMDDPNIPVEYFDANDDLGKDYKPTIDLSFDLGAPVMQSEVFEYAEADVVPIDETEERSSFRPGWSGNDDVFPNPEARGSSKRINQAPENDGEFGFIDDMFGDDDLDDFFDDL